MGTEIPPLGLGTFGRTGAVGIEAMLTAIEIGYRHIDTAQSYDTESSVGAAIRRSGLARDSFFVTTKIADTNLDRSRFGPSLERSLATLGIGPVDLLLIHWPSEKEAVPLEHYLTACRTEGKTAGVHVNCHVHTRTNGLIYHDCDNARGASGGPMFVMKGNEAFIVALNVAEFRNGGEQTLNVDYYHESYANIAIPASAFLDKLVELKK